MKILFITRAYGEQAGGMERLSYEFIQAARQHPNIDVTVIANETEPGITLTQARIRSILFAVKVIPRAFAAAKEADVIHLGDPVISLVGWVIKTFLRKRVVVAVHGLDVTYPSFLYQLYLSIFFQNFDVYLPISSHVKKLLQTHRITGTVSVLSPGVTDRYFDETITRRTLAKLLSLPQDAADTKILLTVGRLVHRKGHAWFIRNVLPHLPGRILYVIAGTGPADSSIQRAIEDAKQADRVRLLGRVTDADLKVMYNTVDIFVQPNIPTQTDAEGFGLVLLEAALCNRPVVAANIEGIPDAIHSGKNGTLVPAGNPNAWVAALINLAPVTHPRGYTLLTFGWPAIIDRYHSLIQQVGK